MKFHKYVHEKIDESLVDKQTFMGEVRELVKFHLHDEFKVFADRLTNVEEWVPATLGL